MKNLMKLTQAIRALREAASYTVINAADDLKSRHDWSQALAIVQDFENHSAVSIWLGTPMYLYYLLELYCPLETLRQTYRECSVMAGFLISRKNP